MDDIDYRATGLGEMTCDGCDKFICYGFVEGYDCDYGLLCSVCKKQREIEEIPQVTKEKQERLAGEFKQKQCGESTEGHQWEDITCSTFCWGYDVFKCIKCNAQRNERRKASSLPFNGTSSALQIIPWMDEILRPSNENKKESD